MLEKSAVTRVASFVGIFVTTLGVAIGAGASGASAEAFVRKVLTRL